MTRVKICGIKTEEHALAAAEAGANFIGMVFTQSPRQITPSLANKIVTALRKAGANVEIVGVFANTPFYVVNRIAEFCKLDMVQLSGNENFEYCAEVVPPIIKVMRIRQCSDPTQICQDIQFLAIHLTGKKYTFLLDTYDEARFGGTGKMMDMEICSQIARKFEVIVAGGLTPENIAEEIKIIRPFGVDVSTGVETGGEKDMNKIKAFVKVVRDADAAYA
jgi:phosphoribosylanthranilate isomerase